ncbi:hypothetical protein D8Y20_05600 [Mariprofundus sp. EBB-1]|uniref:hypothetical protein n=1 Tax=Mariprofundus sp. EBB-1 TaxID=2650971 RepID=UPI000EF22895|nr:hypothetical protein [Mariprofundus sp. EBB-1]RLL53313.1 hypothetical protein D8Y20_05600 [Mariprofundus sp. EBB-1]
MKNYRPKRQQISFTQKLFHLITVLILATLAFFITPITSQASTADEINNERLMLGSLCDCTAANDDAVCHIPPNQYDVRHTIHVNQSAINDHLAHGDTMGACPGDKEKLASIQDDLDGSCTCADGTVGNWYYNSPILTQDSTLKDMYSRR